MDFTKTLNMDDIAKISEMLGLNESNQIAQTDQNLTVGDIYKQLRIPSLGREIFYNLNQNGPIASIFTPYVSDKLSILKSSSEVYDLDPINTELTQEVVKDIFSQFGWDGRLIIEGILSGLASKQENEKTKEFLDQNGVQTTNIVLSNKLNARVIVEEISQAVSENITKMNEDYYMTYSANVVVPMKYAMSFSVRDIDKGNLIDASHSYYMGRQGTARYFVDPDKDNTNKVYVVLNQDFNSGGFFSEYTRDLITTVDPDSGQEKFFMFNRFALSTNPKHNYLPSITTFEVN